MKSNLSTFVMLGAALVLGTIASALTAGCGPQAPAVSVKPAKPPKPAPPPIVKENDAPPKAEPAKTDPVEPKKPETTDGEKPAEKPAGEEKPAEEKKPAGEEKKPEGEKKPADEKKPDGEEKKPAGEKPAKVAGGSLASVDKAANAQIKPGDWPQWMGTMYRNNTPEAKNIPSEWAVGGFDRKTGAWKKDKAENIKWVVPLGSQSYGNPVVAGGKVYVGTNNGAGYLKRYNSKVDLGCLLCFNEADGKFLWQHSSEKLPTGLVHDWHLMGICCAPFVEGDRLWFVTSRGEVRCLDTEGYYDNEDDGPVKDEWIKQFAVEPLVQYGLNDSAISESLADQFAKAGFTLPSGSTVETIEADKKWTISFREGGEEKLFQVRMEGMNVIGSSAIKEGDKLETKDLFTVDARLNAGLEEGKLADTLRGHFALSGIELPADAAPKTATPGKLWTVTAPVGDKERQFRLKMVGPRLTCEKLLTPDDKEEADVVWVLDMMKELGVSQHNMCSCSVTALGDILFVCSSNGVDESHLNVPAPNAPSFMALDKNTGKVLWTDKSPGANIHHGQWSSPTVGMLGGVPQVLFGGGDGWLYSFKADAGKDGSPEFLWKFDTNPKDAVLKLGGRGTRNDIIATPVIYDGLVYVANGQDPEHLEGSGNLWCIDPNKRGDVSAWLAVKRDDPTKPLPYRRTQAVIEEEGEIAIENPNSAVVWRYDHFDQNGDGKITHEESMHRSCGTVAIKDDILYIADFSGLVHCLDAKSGKVHWTHDMLAASWGSPLIVDGKVYFGDEDGDVVIFELKTEKHDPITELNMERAVYTTPIVANGVLYIASMTHLYAIQAPAAGE